MLPVMVIYHCDENTKRIYKETCDRRYCGPLRKGDNNMKILREVDDRLRYLKSKYADATLRVVNINDYE